MKLAFPHSPNFLHSNFCRHSFGEISASRQGSHVPPELNRESRKMNHPGTTSPVSILSLRRLLKLFKVRTQQLLQVRKRGTMPRNRKDSTPGSRVLPNHRTRRGMQLMYGVFLGCCNTHFGVKVSSVRLNGRGIFIQNSER